MQTPDQSASSAPNQPAPEGSAEQPETTHKDFVHDRKLEALKQYAQQEANGNLGDATARRNIGANGYTQRTGQKDQLENLRIGGSEVTGQGGLDHETPGERAAGPGFESEGTADLGNPTRSRDQEFGDSQPSGPARPAQD